MKRVSVISAVLSIMLLAVPNLMTPAAASPFTGGTAAWVIQGQPSMSTIQGQPTAKVIYMNTLNVTIPLALVYVVVRNSISQTVFVNPGTVSSPTATGANATAYIVIYNVPSGSYTATFFATLPSGTAMSVGTSMPINI